MAPPPSTVSAAARTLGGKDSDEDFMQRPSVACCAGCGDGSTWVRGRISERELERPPALLRRARGAAPGSGQRRIVASGLVDARVPDRRGHRAGGFRERKKHG